MLRYVINFGVFHSYFDQYVYSVLAAGGVARNRTDALEGYHLGNVP